LSGKVVKNCGRCLQLLLLAIGRTAVEKVSKNEETVRPGTEMQGNWTLGWSKMRAAENHPYAEWCWFDESFRHTGNVAREVQGQTRL
jgi:hypothetical protein